MKRKGELGDFGNARKGDQECCGSDPSSTAQLDLTARRFVAELEAQSLTLRTATVEDVTRLCSELRLAAA